MKLLVTGGSGLVGRYIVAELAKSHTVTVLDLKQIRQKKVAFQQADVLDLPVLTRTIKNFDAVIHLAGIPHPLDDLPDKVFQVNAQGTFNVLEACARNKIKKVIFLSSESTLGFAFSTQRHWPAYVPIDEDHPLRAQDSYGLSKVACELLCAGFTRRTGAQTICLRAPWAWVPEKKEIEFYRKIFAEYSKWHKNLWAYIHVLDLAQAIKLAVETPGLKPHDIFFVCADDNWTNRDSLDLLYEFYRETRDIRPGFVDQCSFISNAKAKAELNFKPRYTWADVLMKSF